MSALASRFHHHLDRDPLRPPQAPGLGRGFAFAVAAHLVLVLALSAGVHWRTQTLPSYEAELWAAVPQAAAPREQLPPEEPPAPKPQPRPEPKPAEPDPRELQAQRDAQIAIAKAEKKKKDLEQKRLAELEAAERKAKELAAKKEQARKEELAMKQRQAEAAARDAKEAKEAKEAKQAEAKREALRQENLRRIQGMAGASGGPAATGSALQSSGPSASYGGRIKARIRPNIIYSDMPSGNPVAEVEVRVAPDGSIIGRKIIKPSGDAEWDKAVLRAIDKTETLPRDVDGRVPSLLVISFQPRE
ncbi:cell envelope integrity protein TolA [Paucibacter soli]|uniref:cell envelope integrity protein TolA n=1 Tax=Paucibacter soli TaxID=3133433 RepID=UPI0030A2D11B